MKVAVIMGSLSDVDQARKVFDKLDAFGVGYEKRVISAHRALDVLEDYVAEFESREIGVVIALAGKAAHLAGVIAGMVTLPVIGVPIKSSTMDGLDSLLSIVQMPSGIPVATVAINGGENAAILATQILAVADPKYTTALRQDKLAMKEKIIAQNAQLGES